MRRSIGWTTMHQSTTSPQLPERLRIMHERTALIFQMLPAGFEPATCGLGIRCSIHLSYESARIFKVLR